MQLSTEQIEEFKRIFKEVYNIDLTDEDARESAHNLVGLMKTLLTVDTRLQHWNEQLKKSPKGFHLPDTGVYSCCVCHGQVSGITGWYDANGVKCLPCQRAVEDEIIPPSVCLDKKGWFDMADLKSELGIHSATARKMVRTGELKARIIKDRGTDYFYVFLKNENENLTKS